MKKLKELILSDEFTSKVDILTNERGRVIYFDLEQLIEYIHPGSGYKEIGRYISLLNDGEVLEVTFDGETCREYVSASGAFKMILQDDSGKSDPIIEEFREEIVPQLFELIDYEVQ